MSEYSDYSKEMGWDGPQIQDYPTMDAVAHSDWKMRFKWNRYLRSPKNDEEIAILNEILNMGYRPE